MSPPQVSVLMAAYNAERYIGQAIESIRMQSLADWELVVCDDGSCDSTRSLVQQAAARDPRVRFVGSPVNAGMSAARNRAFESSCGTWCAIMDADDLIAPNRLMRQLEWTRAYPNDVIATGYDQFGDVQTDRCDLFLPFELTNAAAWVTTPCAGPSLFVHRSVFESVGGYTESIRHDTEDIDLILRLVRAGHRVRVIPESLYHYRVHAASHCGRNHERFWRRYDQFVTEQWATHMSEHAARRALYDLTMAGMLSADWPAGKPRHIRRKAAGIAVLIAARLARFGEHGLAWRLLREAAALCWWRVDAYLTAGLVPFGASLQVTGFADRRLPRIYWRRGIHLRALA